VHPATSDRVIPSDDATDRLMRRPGVGQVTQVGERRYSMRVWLIPAQLAKLGINAQDVIGVLPLVIATGAGAPALLRPRDHPVSSLRKRAGAGAAFASAVCAAAFIPGRACSRWSIRARAPAEGSGWMIRMPSMRCFPTRPANRARTCV